MSNSASAPTGVLVVDKPPGPSSFQIVAGVRRFFGTRAVGHAGTLDPMASGVLVVLVGEATKLSNYLTLADKEYHATVEFGLSTDTLDALGQETARAEIAPGALSEALLEGALRTELGRSEQVPPQYSAIKVDGRRAYALSRKGQTVDLPARSVRIISASMGVHTEASAAFSLHVSKGYYVRSFARDLGISLSLPSHLGALRRTASGCFELAESVSWPLPEHTRLINIDEAVQRALPVSNLRESAVLQVKQGKPIQADDFEGSPNSELSAWLSPAGHLVALGAWRQDRQSFRVTRGFNTLSPELTDAASEAD